MNALIGEELENKVMLVHDAIVASIESTSKSPVRVIWDKSKENVDMKILNSLATLTYDYPGALGDLSMGKIVGDTRKRWKIPPNYKAGGMNLVEVRNYLLNVNVNDNSFLSRSLFSDKPIAIHRVELDQIESSEGMFNPFRSRYSNTIDITSRENAVVGIGVYGLRESVPGMYGMALKGEIEYGDMRFMEFYMSVDQTHMLGEPNPLIDKLLDGHGVAYLLVLDHSGESTTQPLNNFDQFDSHKPQEQHAQGNNPNFDAEFTRARVDRLMGREPETVSDSDDSPSTTRYHFVTANFGLPGQDREMHYVVDLLPEEAQKVDRNYWLTKTEVEERLNCYFDHASGELSWGKKPGLSHLRGPMKCDDVESGNITVDEDEGVNVLSLDQALAMQDILIDIYEQHFGEDVIFAKWDGLYHYCKIDNILVDGYHPEAITLNDLLTSITPDASVSFCRLSLADAPDDSIVELSPKEFYRRLIEIRS